MAYNPLNPNGQATMANSQPVVIASNQSPINVSGTSSVQVIGGIGVIGSVATLQGTNPWIVQLTSGSVITAGGNSSVQVVGLMPPQSVSGVGLFNVNHVGNGSILIVSLGSIATAPFPASISGVGIFNVNHIGNGSVISTNQVTRNDTLASFLGVDLTPRYMSGDSSGRVLIKPFAPNHASVFGHGSVNGAASVIVVGSPPTGLRNYITDVMLANTGSVATIVNLTAGGGSILARTIAPATGGSNIIGMAMPIAVPAGSPFNIEAVTAVSVLYGTAYGYTAE